MKIHKIKIRPDFFADVCSDLKNFEIRENDRNYQVGDKLVLCEYDSDVREYTGRVAERKIIYITDYAQKDNFIVMSIARTLELA